MSDAKQLDARMLQMQDALASLSDANRQQVARAMAHSITRTIADLKVAYSKFETSGGESNRYTIESQTARYRELMKAADGLFDPPALKRVGDIYERDLNEAYKIGTGNSRELSKIVDGVETSAANKITKMPIAAQVAAGQSLKKFWEKEKAAMTAKVTEATLTALQRGKGWRAAQKDIAQALRTEGQTVLRGKDELSISARTGLRMNLEQRADLIARTELASAYIAGQMAQYRKNGYTHGRWSATGERTCPFCASREGSIYTLDELDGAIPAHPRCRCTVAPVMGDNVKKVQDATDKEAAAAQYLDDTGWAAIRQQRFEEYLKFTGKKELDASKWLNTPTSKEKFLRGKDAKAAKPEWIPSGQAQPDLAAAQKAAERAKQQTADTKLTPEESIAADVMADTRFKSDAMRVREMRARLRKAGLDPDQDFVDLTARAREKGALTPEAKAERKDLQRQKEEAAKKEAEVAKREKAAKGDAELQKLKEQAAAKRGELKVIDAELDPLLKRNKQIKEEREALQKERTFRHDMQKELTFARDAAEPAQQRKLQAFMAKFQAGNELKTLQEKLANVKPGKKGEKFNLDKYDGTIAAMNHDLETLKVIGQDVLKRAGVTMQEVKTPAAGAASQDTLDAIRKEVATAKAYAERYKKNLSISKKNIKTIQTNEEYALSRAKRALERGDITQAEYEVRIKTIRENTQKGVAKEQEYIDKEGPTKIKEWKDKQSAAEAKLDAASKTSSGSAAQKVIDELVSSSPITRKQAEALVKEAASTAARKKSISDGRSSGLRPVPKEIGLEHMVDAVQMYGTRSSMDRYGLSSERAHAHARTADPRTGDYRFGKDGYVNSGAGYGDFRGTQFHELGHHLEMQNSDFYRASREFLKQRAEAGDGTPNSKMEIGSPLWLGLAKGNFSHYGRNEVGYVMGKAYSPYVLKEYDSGRINQYRGRLDSKEVYGWETAKDYTSLHQKASLATEVVSMGVEKLSSASNLQRLAEQDSEHLLLSLGVVKVQQARAKMGKEQLRGDEAAVQPKTMRSEVPEGTSGQVDSDAVKKSLKRDIDGLESTIKKLEKNLAAAEKAANDTNAKASKIFDEISKLRELEVIKAAQEALEDQSMALWEKKSPLEKSRRQIEVDLEELDKRIKALEEPSKR